MHTSESMFLSIEAAVKGGKAVVSADDSIIIAMMQEALKHGRSATFYVSPAQAQAVMRVYWTPRRAKEIGYESVSKEERARIESELGVKDMGPWFSNRIQCPCGGVYGAFEFIEQGLRHHGKDWVGAVVELKNAAVLRINPAQDAFCPVCRQILPTGHWYGMYAPDGTLIYGCCSGPDVLTA
ncbi:MAG TPA: hypothetical protein PKK23_13975 [Nitrospirales bacterium]|nr:hypothetical protein [Nitrospiraceae bacterium]HNP30151.1 hypothetical protein [Nitrospirales bacterium]